MEILLRRKNYLLATKNISALLAKSRTIPLNLNARVTKDACNLLARSLSSQVDPNKGFLGKLFGPESNTASQEFRSRWLMV